MSQEKLDKKNIEDIFPLTPLQEGILFQYLKNPGSDLYFEQLGIRLTGAIDRDLFTQTWNHLVEVNPALRTVFRWERVQQPVQAVLKNFYLQPRYTELTGGDACQGLSITGKGERFIEELKKRDREEKFDLTTVAFRVTLGKIAAGDYIMIVSNHHILYDGWSTGIIIKDFFRLYAALESGEEITGTVKQGYKEFVQWGLERGREKDEEFWPEYLRDFSSEGGWSGKMKRISTGGQAREYGFEMGVDWRLKLERLAANEKITMAAILYTTYGLLLQRMMDCTDVVFGVTVAGRSAKIKGIEELVGLFINTLPLRVKTEEAERVMDLLVRVNAGLSGLAMHEQTRLVDIHGYVEGVGQDQTTSELFDSIVVIENYPLEQVLSRGDRGLKVHSFSAWELTHYPLTVMIKPLATLEIKLVYHEGVWNEEDMVRMGLHWQRLLEDILNEGEKRVEELEWLTLAEKEQLLFTFNNTKGEYPQAQTVLGMLEMQVAKTPDWIALVGMTLMKDERDNRVKAGVGLKGNETQLTLAQLNSDGTRLARHLQESGIRPGVLVGVRVERTIDMMVALVAIMKAGGAYLPIDPRFPAERVKYILEESQATLLISDKEVENGNDMPCTWFNLEGERKTRGIENGEDFSLSLPGDASDLLYVNYTSGSTGKPKGVMIENRGVVNFITGMKKIINFTGRDRLLTLTSISFDIFMLETFLPLSSGTGIIIGGLEEQLKPGVVMEVFKRHDITLFQVTPSRLNMLLSHPGVGQCLGRLTALMIGGEELRDTLLSSVCGYVKGKIYNLYGPTETTVWSTVKDVSAGETLNIGSPIQNTQVFITGRLGRLQPVGVPGELLIGGDGLARGYLNNPGLTAEKFVWLNPGSWSRDDQGKKKSPGTLSEFEVYGQRVYRTGDLARWLGDGNIEFLGRMDFQVKIRGYRVEPGEIENILLKMEGLEHAVVVLREEKGGEKYLCAYISGNKEFSVSGLRDRLTRELPDYAVPSFFVQVKEMPLTASGKIDRKQLPEPAGLELKSREQYVAPRAGVEQRVGEAWKEVLGLKQVSIHDNFFEVGGNSLLLIRLNSRLNTLFNEDIPILVLFDHPTIARFSTYWEQRQVQGGGVVTEVERERSGVRVARGHGEIGIIGMGVRFPGARNVEQLWENLKNGVESIVFFSKEELLGVGIEPEWVEDVNYIRAKGLLEGIEYFDSSFFNYTAIEAEQMDPQIRFFHECAWEAFEDAGYDPGQYGGVIGVFAGSAYNYRWMNRFFGRGYNLAEYFEAGLLNDRDFLSTRVSYKLDLKGPSFTLQAACSTSLVAVHQAYRAILSGDCDMAIAGGVSITLPGKAGYPYMEGMVFSPDGHCRAFDAEAGGTLFGDGVGLVVLKRLDEALASGDNLYAVIKGSAINNDGVNKVGYTAPSIEGQAQVIRAALEISGVEPESIGYIEAHGTATKMGDPIEIEGLKRAFRTEKRGYCGVGSIKTNIGHLNIAAGVAGLIKASLALKYGQIPPSLHYKKPLPAMDIENSPFYINAALKDWQVSEGQRRRAGVSSFGIGGTNVHIILEEAPGQVGVKSEVREYKLMVLSARTPANLGQMMNNLALYFKKHGEINLEDVAYTLQQGRKVFENRASFVCTSTRNAVEILSIPGNEQVDRFSTPRLGHPVVFMFSGQGSQYVNMGRGLYESEGLFRAEVERCLQILKPLTDIDIKGILYPSGGDEEREEATRQLNSIKYSGPVKLLFEYSLAKLLMAWGIVPQAMIGHSFGEYTAACIAGVLSLEDAFKLTVLRGLLMARMPKGAMMSVPISEQELQSRSGNDLSIAAVNAPSLCIASGSPEAVDRLEQELEKEGHNCLRFNVTVAGHSHMMVPFRDEFESYAREIEFKEPQIPYISGLTGQWITVEQATSPHYWARHMTETIRFGDGVGTVINDINPILIQVGSDRGLPLCVDRHPLKVNPTFNIIRHPKEVEHDVAYLLKKLGQLWLYGVKMDWDAFYGNEKRKRISLPTYPFTRLRYSVDVSQPATMESGERSKGAGAADWFYISSLENYHKTEPGAGQVDEGDEEKGWMVYTDAAALGSKILERMKEYREDVIVIKRGLVTGGDGRKGERANVVRRSEYVAPTSKNEQILARIWQEAFGIERIGIQDDFFQLGGDSLKAVMVINRIRKETQSKITLAEFFVQPTIEKLAGLLGDYEEPGEASGTIPRAEEKEYYSLSSGQKRLYLIQQADPDTIAYNIPVVMMLTGEIDLERLETIFLQLIERHEIFRTSFEMIHYEPVQRVYGKEDWGTRVGKRSGFHIERYAGETGVGQDEAVMIHRVIEGFVRPFVLTCPSLFRVGILELSGARTLFMLDMHHIIADGYAIGIFKQEFLALYGGKTLGAFPLQYKDYSEWLLGDKGERERREKEQVYWLREYSGELPGWSLPLDWPRPLSSSYEGSVVEFELDAMTTGRIKQLAEERGATVFIVLLTVLDVWLARLTGKMDLVVGSPAINRGCTDAEGIMGMFVNTLALRMVLDGGESFAQTMDRVKQKSLGAFENQGYGFDDLVNGLGIKREQGRNPLFDVMFSFQDQWVYQGEVEKIEMEGVTFASYGYRERTAKFDLTIHGYEIDRGSRLQFRWEYAVALFKGETVKRWLGYFLQVIQEVLSDPGQAIGMVELIPGEEKERLLDEFNRTAAYVPLDKALHLLFEEQVMETPGNVAVVFGDLHLTFGELNREVNGLAAGLRRRGVNPGDVVGILLNRSPWIIVAMLGVLKNGGIFLPLDMEYPVQRQRYLLSDSAARCLITGVEQGDESLVHIHEEYGFNGVIVGVQGYGREVGLVGNHEVMAKDGAYVIYTSGSTGMPKGVLVEHGSIVNYLWWAMGQYVKHEPVNFPFYTSPAFDLTLTSIFLPLITGNGVVVYGESGDVPMIEKVMMEQRVDGVKLTPSHLKMIREYGHGCEGRRYSRIKRLVVGGEELETELAEDIYHLFKSRWNCEVEIYNEYGPTEAAVGCMIHCFKPGEEGGRSVPIGIPAANTGIYLLDALGQPVPWGSVGEIVIAGHGLARGYLNQPGLTMEKFVKAGYRDASGENGYLGKINRYLEKQGWFVGKESLVIYKTGDQGRFLADGTMAYVGRGDAQVKIRGYRVELGEIENRLVGHEKVKDAVVTVTGVKKDCLCAYIVPMVSVEGLEGEGNDGVGLKRELKEYLSGVLPVYMIPAYLIFIDSIRLTVNGKVDKSALPVPGGDGEEGFARGEYVHPRNAIERVLAGIWAEVLGKEVTSIGIDSNFFELGGHSLSVVIMISKIQSVWQVKIPFSQVFKTPTIRELSSQLVDGEKTQPIIIIEPVERQGYYPLSAAQKRLFILDRLVPGSIGYNLPFALQVEGETGAVQSFTIRVEQVFRGLMARHESLRTCFTIIDDQPVQVVDDQVGFEISTISLGDGLGLPGEIEKIMEGFVQPFNLSCPPLLRVALVVKGAREYLLLVDMHHIITDGISRDILTRDFAALFTGGDLPGLPLQYKDFSQWQNRQKNSLVMKQQESYWLGTLSGELPVIHLPIDYTRPPVQDYAGATVMFEISPGQYDALQRIGYAHDATLFMVLLAVYTVFLAKISSQEDMVVGTDIAGRSHPGLEHVVGMFVNALALRHYPVGEKTFNEYLDEVKDITLQAFENQDYAFEDLVERVNIERDASRNPLFDVFFAYQNRGMGEELLLKTELQGVQVKPYVLANRTAKFDLTLNVEERREGLSFLFEYAVGLFSRETIQRLIGYFKTVVASITQGPGQVLSSMEMVSREDKERILFHFNDTRNVEMIERAKHKSFSELFEEQVERTPEKVAGIWNNEEITYAMLNHRAGLLAAHLHNQGLGAGAIVPLVLTRSIDGLVAILGVFKAGCAYLPIETGQPVERVKEMIEDSGAGLIISQEWHRLYMEALVLSLASPVFVLYLDNLTGYLFKQGGVSGLYSTGVEALGQNLAYIIYTSGSTGKPKGAMVHQAGMINHLYAKIHDLSMTGEDRMAQTASIAFDISVWQYLAVLLVGGTCVIFDKEIILQPREFLRQLEGQRVTILELVPSLMKAFLDVVADEHDRGGVVGELAHLRWMIPTGEALGVALAREWYSHYPGIKLVNAYGPTEASDDVTHHVVENILPAGQITIPIGKPLPNLHIYILDRYMNLCPVGIPGEITVAGIGVGLGYANDIDKTVERFCRNPFLDLVKDNDYQVIYRTGDIGFFREDGRVECLGRMDHQVKIRGYRIEPGEIESHLLEQPAIDQVVVAVIKDRQGNSLLCAYMVPVRGETIDLAHLKNELAVRLPAYMIPAYFRVMEKLPLTANGKVDRKALPCPDLGDELFKSLVEGPGDEIEQGLIEIWSDLLGIPKERIGVESDFFNLGGHSLSATLLVSRIHRSFQVHVPLVEVFRSPQVRAIAGFIRRLTPTPELFFPVERVEMRDYYLTSSGQKRLYILQQMDVQGTSYNMPELVRLREKPDLEKIKIIFHKLIERHESLRTSFHLVEGEPVQRIHARHDVDFSLDYFFTDHDNDDDGDLDYHVRLRQNEQGITMIEQVFKNFVRPFDLSRASLLRAGVVQDSKEHFWLMIDMHHIISDGVSHDILVQDFGLLYRGKDLPEPRIQYKDYSHWQSVQEKSQPEKFKKQESFWLGQLATLPAALVLPADDIDSHMLVEKGNPAHFQFGQEETAALNELARQHGATLFMVLLSLYNILLMKLTGQVDIVVGIPIEGRRHIDLRQIIGMFVNMLALRNNPSLSRDFTGFLEKVKENTIQAFENQDFPFDELVKKVFKNRMSSQHPLFNVTLALEVLDTDVQTGRVLNDIIDLDQEMYKYQDRSSKFDLDLLVIEMGGALYFTWDYNVRLFKESTVQRFIEYFKRIANTVVKNPRQKIQEIEIIAEEDKQNLLENIKKDQEDVLIEFDF